MKIWIDGYEANVSQRLGSSQVAFELLRNLEKIDQENDYTVILPNPPLPDLPAARTKWQYRVLRFKKFWTWIALPLALWMAREKPDLIFSPTHYIPHFIPTKIKQVATIFDLAFLHCPQFFQKDDLWKLKHQTSYTAKQADHLITISTFSKKDIIKQYGLRKEKITVAYPGYDSSIFVPIKDQVEIRQICRKYQITLPYIIFIGTIQPKKNLTRLIEAFVKIDNSKLVVVGKTTGLGRQGWMFEEILAKPRQLGIEEKVIFTGFVPTQDLPYLLSGAQAFVLPSLYEGFGIPVVEAMACGTPVIVANTGALPEVAGKAGLFVNPYSVDQIEQAIRTIVTDSKLRNQKIKAGLLQAQKFSWKKMAKTVLKVFFEM